MAIFLKREAEVNDKIELGLTIGLFLFFGAFFLCFTLIPRYIFFQLDKLLGWRKERFWANYYQMLKTYLVLGLPIGSIIFFALNRSDQELLIATFGTHLKFIVAITTAIILTTIRLSLLLEKRKILRNIKPLKRVDRIIPPIVGTRKKLKEEYVSYFFDVFFTAFMSFIIFVLFKVIFLRKQTQVSIGGFTGSVETMLASIGNFFLVSWPSILTLLGIVLFGELMLHVIGVYPQFWRK